MKQSIRHLAARVALVLGLGVAAAMPARAGIPVIDAANLMQSIQDVINSITQIENQIQQIQQLQTQINSITGSRNLGTILNSTALQNYVPANANAILTSINSTGYSGLSGNARSLRDASMVYNCLDMEGTARTQCQASLAHPYQHKSFMQDALSSASGRLGQINGLLSAINGTTDPKGIQELQARITGETAMLQHEMSRIHTAQYLAEAERQVQASQARERELENLRRPYLGEGSR
jgi:type IV secretion system protein VirB5